MPQKKNRQSKRAFLPIIFIIAAMVFFFLSRNTKKDYDRLQRSGIVIEGIILKKRLSTSDDYGDKYYLKYQYIYKNTEYTDENRVYGEFYEKIKINDPVSVRILMNEPDKSQINSSLIFPESEDYKLITIILFITAIAYTLIPYFINLNKKLKERQKS